MTKIIPTTNSNNKIKTARLDNLLKKVDNIVFLKIDVEGSELDVLKSAINILKIHKPILLVESKLDNITNTHNFLCNLNYNITKKFKSDPHLYIYEFEK